jgi:hypothetical protein
MKVLSIVGVRPQFIKASTVSRALAAAGIEEGIVHSGQHYDDNMSQVFFDELDLRPPIRHLGIGAESNARQVGRMLIAVEEAIRELEPRLVIVYGDTNTTLAGAIAANTVQVPVAHVEAGLRSFNHGIAFGGMIGGGVSYKLGKGYVLAEMRYHHLFSQLTKNVALDLIPELTYEYGYIDDKFGMGNVSLSLGYTYPIYSPKKLR